MHFYENNCAWIVTFFVYYIVFLMYDFVSAFYLGIHILYAYFFFSKSSSPYKHFLRIILRIFFLGVQILTNSFTKSSVLLHSLIILYQRFTIQNGNRIFKELFRSLTVLTMRVPKILIANCNEIFRENNLRGTCIDIHHNIYKYMLEF